MLGLNQIKNFVKIKYSVRLLIIAGSYISELFNIIIVFSYTKKQKRLNLACVVCRMPYTHIPILRLPQDRLEINSILTLFHAGSDTTYSTRVLYIKIH